MNKKRQRVENHLRHVPAVAGPQHLAAVAALTVFAALIFTLSARAELPVIQSIRVEPTNLVVTARVPAGRVRVVLESRALLRSGAWVPVAVRRGSGEGGTIDFRVPSAAEFACFRVRADAAEPLPASFYTGTSLFDPQPVTGPVGLFPSLPGPGWGVPISVFQPISISQPISIFQPMSISGDTPMLFATTTSQSADVAAMSSTASSAVVESREVVESDIWRLDGDTLYFFNQNSGLQIIDVSNPDAATVRGMLNLPNAGEQMHLLSPDHIVLLTRSACGMDANGEVLIVAVSDGAPHVVARLPVVGAITESRLVGTALYVASETARPGPGGGSLTWETGTQVTSFDLAAPAAPVARSTLWYPGGNNVVHASDTYFFAITPHATNGRQSVVNAIDITNPDGTMNALESVTVAGRVADKFKLNWSEGVLSVISMIEVPGNPLVTKLETFRLSDPRSASSLATTKLGEVELGRGERLFATRFDGTRAYVVTFLQIDPLWVVDLSDPVRPTVSGELEVPGWSTYIHPLGDRLVAVGVETNRATVSLFDVSDPGHPTLRSRVSLGNSYSTSEANRDEKAFTVLEDAGLILLPVESTTIDGHHSWVQLIDLGANSLTARGKVQHEFVPRRATFHRDRIVSFSAVELLSVDATDRDEPQLSGRLELALPVNRVFLAGDHLIQIASGDNGNAPTVPAVRVAQAQAPGQILTALALTNAPVVGATVRGNRLYLVQARNSYSSPWIQLGDDGNTNAPAPGLCLTILDLSSLPALSVLGQTVVAASLGWNSELEPVWPRPGLLVWAVSSGNYHPGWSGLWNPVQPGGLISFGWLSPYQPQTGGSRLLAFDVSDDTAPALLSDINLASSGGWNFSKPFATGGLVYLSHQAYVELEATNTASLTNVMVLYGGWQPRLQNSFLDVVDYADVSQPTVRQPVNIPGTLRGISHQGELLYTVGRRSSTNWNGSGEELAACAYDGVSVYLVATLALSESSPRPILVSGTNVFLGRAQAAVTNQISQTLETWTLSGTGDFVQLDSLLMPVTVSELVSFPGLLAAGLGGNRVMVFDRSDPAALRLVGEGPTTGCLNFNLRQADAAIGQDLWLPLDAYGVTQIKLSR